MASILSHNAQPVPGKTRAFASLFETPQAWICQMISSGNVPFPDHGAVHPFPLQATLDTPHIFRMAGSAGIQTAMDAEQGRTE